MFMSSSRARTLVLLLACWFSGVPSAQSAAVVDNADIQVNFGSFVFRDAGGESVVEGIDVETAAAFNVTSDVEIGNANADTTGTAVACNLADCGIISIFPLGINSSAAAAPPAVSRGVGSGRADGALSIANDSGVDLTIDFFLEADLAWDQLAVGDASSETASLGWLLGFEYDGTVTEVANETIVGDEDGVSVEELCPDFPNDLCNLRENFEGLPLPAGATRTFAGFVELTAFAEARDALVPLPSTIALISLMPALTLLCRRRRIPRQ